MQTLRSLHQAGQLDALTEQLLLSPTRPAEELYRWHEDRWQVSNLAQDDRHQAELVQLRQRLDRWMDETKDHGPESEAMYDSDMAVYLGGRARPRNGATSVTQRNIELMKRWAQEGK